MDIFLGIVFLGIGFVFIIKGGDWFVESSSWIARIAGIPEIIIGATIVSIGTTLPELITSLSSAIRGLGQSAEVSQSFNELAVANSIGSMLCNTGLILAVVMLIKPPKTEGKGFLTKAVFVIGVCIALTIFVLTGSKISLFEAIILLAVFVGFMSMNIFEAIKDSKADIGLAKIEEKRLAKESAKKENKAKMIILFLVGAVGIALGANLLVMGAEKICNAMHIPSQIVGITVVAVGTSLPELVTSFTALKKGNSDIGVGNIIGAHIINATLIVGSIGVVTGSGMPIDWITRNVSIFVMLGITLVLCVPSIFLKRTTKIQGGLMLASYLGFITYNVIYVVQNLG